MIKYTKNVYFLAKKVLQLASLSYIKIKKANFNKENPMTKQQLKEKYQRIIKAHLSSFTQAEELRATIYGVGKAKIQEAKDTAAYYQLKLNNL